MIQQFSPRPRVDHLLHRRLQVEALEDRRMLSVVTVDTGLDTVDPDDGVTSLREAIFTTNTVAGPDDIVFDFGRDPPRLATILLTQGELEITEALTITGAGPDLLTIDAQQQSRIFNITPEMGDFEIAGMTLTGGRTTGDNAFPDTTFSGGAIRSATTGSLTIENSDIRDHQTIGADTLGGGVFARGDVTISGSTISGNSAGFRGGGIGAWGTLVVTSSTLTGNSAGEHGAGIYTSLSQDVTVTSSTIIGNSAGKGGGGIHSGGGVMVNDSSISENGHNGVSAEGHVTVTGSTISENGGGGIYATHGDVTVAGSTISGNNGSGIDAGDVTVTGSTIIGNSAGAGGGGGIRAYGNVSVTHSTISGNVAIKGNAGPLGGGIGADGDVTVTDSTISGNHSRFVGGGVFAGRDVTITSSTVSGNSARDLGGGILALHSVTVDHSSISGNSTEGVGGAIWAREDPVMIKNSIVAGNTDRGTAPDLRPGTGTLIVENSLIGDNTGTILTEAPVGSPDAHGNLIGGSTGGLIDPMLGPLTNNGGPTFTHALLIGSPAIDAGDPLAVPGVGDTPEFDQRGEPYSRLADGSGDGIVRIDMGAFEVPDTFVVDTLVDESDGDFSESDLSLREAIEQANAVTGPNNIFFDTGLFAGGAQTMVLTIVANDDPQDGRSAVRVTDTLTIAGPGQDLLTIDAAGLDATAGVPDGMGARIFNFDDGTGDNTFTAVVSGMTLTGGDVGNPSPHPENGTGGGAIRAAASLKVSETTISRNTASADGGGIWALGDLNVTSSTIRGNSANWGGGISTFNPDDDPDDAATDRHLTIANSSISGNSAGAEGGGIYNQISATIVTSSTISGNSADGSGGGISSRGGAVTVNASTISGNSTGSAGGGIHVNGGLVTVTGSVISGNSAEHGGGIRIGYNPIRIVNSIVAGNTNNGTAPDLKAGRFTLSVVEYSLIGDSTGTGLTEAPVGMPDTNGNLIGGPISGVIDPLLDPLADNGGPTWTHALLVGSPAIDAGDPLALAGEGDVPVFDQRGAPYGRVYDGDGVDGPRIDMGAFELQPRPGDLNGDLLINFGDLAPFAIALTEPDAYEAIYPDLDRVFLCDVSGDGLCNFDDLAPLAALLTDREGGTGVSASDGDTLQLAAVPGDLSTAAIQPGLISSAARRDTSSTNDRTGLRDRALIAWLASLREEDADGNAGSAPRISETAENYKLPVAVVESVFQGMGG